MILLVSGSTRTMRGLASRWKNRLGHLLSPRGGHKITSVLDTGLLWAADNDAFTGFDAVKFRRFLHNIALQPRCLFVPCPDVVANARATLTRFGEWAMEVRASGQPVAFVGQDGIEELTVPWKDFNAWFVGGSTRWKLSQASADICSEAKRRNKWVHIGRVNSLRRIQAAFDMGADSIDGTATSMFGDVYINKFCCHIEQLHHQNVLFT